SYEVIFLAWLLVLFSCNLLLAGNAFQYHLYKNSEVYKTIHGDSGDKTDQTETYSAEADKGDEETYSDNRQQMEAEQTDSSYSSDYGTEPQETMNSWKSHGN
ncbi:MAG: hypothetical protein JRF04_04475, partial [Deltaproteobacteria bacterium]|nr:hypothetical protein [Deltaproteobacteria bacterium]